MNAWVSARSAITGSAAVTPGMRAAATENLQSLARANVMGKALPGHVIAKMEGVQDPASEDALGRDAFLRLLLNQVANQDPLDPVDNSEMVAQLAQFSSLEQMNNVATGIETMAGNIDQLNFINATGLLGREVSGIDTDGEPIQGVVQHVQLDGSVVMLTVNDRLVSMAGVQAIREVPVEP